MAGIVFPDMTFFMVARRGWLFIVKSMARCALNRRIDRGPLLWLSIAYLGSRISRRRVNSQSWEHRWTAAILLRYGLARVVETTLILNRVISTVLHFGQRSIITDGLLKAYWLAQIIIGVALSLFYSDEIQIIIPEISLTFLGFLPFPKHSLFLTKHALRFPWLSEPLLAGVLQGAL